MSQPEYIVGTRGSPLALAQARQVAAALERAHPSARFTIRTLTTQGDVVLDKSLPAIGGKGLFTAELERALLDGDVHFAVHSMKDLPTDLPPGLCVASVPGREDPRDVLVLREGRGLDDLPAGAAVGSSSMRRRAQLLAVRSDLALCDIRGNVGTRLRKVREGQVDATILAAAGLKRLGLMDAAMAPFDVDAMIPAVGQGALTIETAEGGEAAALAAAINAPDAADCVAAERAFLDALGGGCHVPIAGHATLAGGEVRLAGLVASPDGTRVIKDRIAGSRRDAAALGARLAERLAGMGAEEILASIA